MFSYKQDDIVALATPPGFGALAVIRFSGTNLSSLYTKFTSKAKPIDRRAVFSKIHHPLTRHVLDEAVVTFFKAPNSYTGEDLMEISCHGGESVPNNIIKSSIESGVRAAEPGEFSFRAFMNGKMDLIQAEAVSSLIYSKSSLSADISLNQIGGKISRLFNGIKSKVLTILTIIENELNFSENEITLTTYQQIKLEVQDVCNKIFDVFETTTFGKKIFTGIRVVIYGKPNSGKSSLFNAILGYDRAIVSSQAGTTRDTIEAWIELAGVSVCLIDTAGVWESRDYLERLGIEKAHSELDNADVCILVDEKDPTEFLHNGRRIKNTNHFILAQTKVDRLVEQGSPSNNILQTSSKNNTGIRELLTALSTYIKDNINIPDRVDKVLTSQRQRIILERAYVVLKETLHLISQGVETDIIASQLREFINLIDEIVGEVTNEDVIHNIFQNFCVGK